MDRSELREIISCRAHAKRIPCWYNYFAHETRERYGSVIDELCNSYHDDFLMFEPDDCDFPFGDNNTCLDIWGTRIVRSPDGVGINVTEPALLSWDHLDRYLDSCPDPRGSDRFAHADAKATALQTDPRYRLGVFWLSFFERLHMIRGMDHLFLDFYTHPEELRRLMAVVKDYLMGTIDEFASRGMDGIILGEDWGMQDRLMIAPEMWRSWFRPHYADIIDRIHETGMDAWLHSCGHIDPIVGDFVDLGLDVLHPLQYGCVDWPTVSRDYGGRICFLGAIDVADTLVRGSPEDVRRHVDDIVATFGRPGGGLILAPANTIMPDTPLQNIEALFERMSQAQV